MKQVNHLGTRQATGASSTMSRRRLMGQVVLGGAAVLALSACGGGGSSDSSSDGTSGQEAKLIAAYDKLEQGMDWIDVEALVGFQANNTRARTILIWVVGSVRLSVEFRSTDTRLISTAELRVGSNVPVAKEFE